MAEDFNYIPARSAISYTASMLSGCEPFNTIYQLIRRCAHIRVSAVADQLEHQIWVFAIQADRCNAADLVKLVSLTDPRVLVLVRNRVNTLIEFADDLEKSKVPFDLKYPSVRPVSSTLIDLWRFYLSCCSSEDN